MFGAMLTACSEESVQDMQPNHEIRLCLGTQHFAPETRTLPTDFEAYTPSASDVQILGFMAPDDTSSPIVQGLFSPSTSSSLPRWSSRVKMEDAGTYYFYGFMPKRTENSATLSLNSFLTTGETLTYKHGATLTIDGLSAISTDDVCVVVGAKGYSTDPLLDINDSQIEMTERLGKFDIYISDDVTDVYLLMDHIYSRLLFKLKIDATYATLRTIKVKRMTLVSADAQSDVVKTVKAEVKIGATDGTQNPILGDEAHSITITNVEMGQPDTPAILYNDEDAPLELEVTTPKEVQAFFAASSVKRFILETTYDVYDRKGNLIRKNEKAQNKFTPTEPNSSTPATLDIGQQYVYTITVAPTYLYVLSEPDLDSPTFTLN